MAHLITKNDGLVLAGQPAWHGLGTVLPNHPDPDEALRVAGLDWEPMKLPLHYNDKQLGAPVQAGKYHALVHSKSGETLAVVQDYEPLLNRDIADLAWELGRQTNPDAPVKVESAGSLRGGRDVFFLLAADPWEIKGDAIAPYLLLTTSHDASRKARIVDTTVRVVCHNTLTDALSNGGGFSFVHTKNIKAAAMAAIGQLALAYKGLQSVREAYTYLSGSPIRTGDAKQFFTDLFVQLEGPVPAEINEQVAYQAKATTMIASWLGAMEATDNVSAGTKGSKLQLVNAVTYVEDRAPTRFLKNGLHDSKEQAVQYRNLHGKAALNKRKAVTLALQLA